VPRAGTGLIDWNDPITKGLFQRAEKARPDFAQDLFETLQAVTGADPLAAGVQLKAGNPAPFNALRWLAQLAVNIVDYLDTDDYMTPFLWGLHPVTGQEEWVFGTELPRLVLNEAYVELANDPQDQNGPKATRPLRYNFWVELHNPFFADATLPDAVLPQRIDYYGAARLQLPGGIPIYQLVIVRDPVDLNAPDNILGTPSELNIQASVSNLTAVDVVQVAKPRNHHSYSGSEGKNEGFYVLGPADVDFPQDPNPMPAVPAMTPTITGSIRGPTPCTPSSATPIAATQPGVPAMMWVTRWISWSTSI
jgi:hypothetical protein